MAGVADAPALALSWTFGSSTDVPNNVLNLSDGYSDRVCYAAAHTGIIYDKKTRRQLFLQGHANSISCIAGSQDRRIIITSDVGQESLLVLWDSRTGNPIQVIHKPHAHGVLAMDVAPGNAWLATLSAPHPETGEQEIAVWPLEALAAGTATRPSVLSAIPAGDAQIAVRFNMNNVREVVSNGRRRVFFWTTHPGSARFKYYSPPLRSKDFKQPVGNYTMSVFVPGSMQALTATSDGDLVVWDEQGITAQMGTRATDRRAIKLMRIHQTAVTYLGTIGDYIVSGGEDGFVRFYDPLLRIVAWFEDLASGPIGGVSFSLAMPARANNPELADTLNRFIVPDFVVFTRTGRLLAVQSSAFEEYDVERRQGTLIVEPVLNDVACVACHPSRAEFTILGACGTLQRWDGIRHTLLARRDVDKTGGAHLAYARDGSFLATAFDNGHISIINPDDLSDMHVARNTPHHVVQLTASSTGKHLAVADSGHQVLLYAFLPYKHIMRWEFVGKARVHHGKIIGLCFGESPSGQTRLFSLGAERRVVEYDLAESTPSAGLVIRQHADLAGPQRPTAMCFAPPLPYFKENSSRTLLLISEDSFKIRVYDPDLQQLCATYLGPTFGGPLENLLSFRSYTSEASFLAYMCSDRVVGLVSWPMDGDPARSMGLVAHPGAIRALAVSHNGRKLVSAGVDGTLSIWDVNTAVLDAQATALGGPERWAAVLDDTDLLSELRDYFMYAQIRAQGEDCMEPRATTGLVPVEALPDLVRAVGFYPSEADVTNMLNHVTFIADSQAKEGLSHVDFETVLALYVNHRPLFDATSDDLAAAFKTLGANTSHGRVQRETLMSLLQQHGETMTLEEAAATVLSLTGAARIADAVPHVLDAATFASSVLGLTEAATDAAPLSVAVSG